MSLWVLDTDMLTLWLRGRETVAARVATTPPQRLAVTIITTVVTTTPQPTDHTFAADPRTVA